MMKNNMLKPILVIALAVAGLTGCGSKPPKPAELAPSIVQLPVRQVWRVSVAPLKEAHVQPLVQGESVLIASADGSITSISAIDGRENWRSSIGAPLAAGVGSDGLHAAAVSATNQLVVLRAGQVLWRQPLAAASYTAPLVAGGRVFVLTAQRHIHAYDVETGRLLWQLQRESEPLVLRQPGVLIPHGNTLVAGLSGRMVAINPDNGAVLWEAPIAAPRGANDVERLVDLVAPAARDGSVVCARAFQASIGCVDVQTARLIAALPARGINGVAIDEQQIYGAESSGVVQAWSREGGSRQWSQTSLRHRQLSAPLSLGRSVVVGDSTGLVHLFSKEDGSPMNRLSTDSSGVATTPVLAAQTLVVLTRSGGVYGFRPD